MLGGTGGRIAVQRRAESQFSTAKRRAFGAPARAAAQRSSAQCGSGRGTGTRAGCVGGGVGGGRDGCGREACLRSEFEPREDVRGGAEAAGGHFATGTAGDPGVVRRPRERTGAGRERCGHAASDNSGVGADRSAGVHEERGDRSVGAVCGTASSRGMVSGIGNPRFF